MNLLHSYASLAACLISLSLGFLVYFKRPERSVNRSFFAAMLSVSVWSFGHFGMTLATNEEIAAIWVRYPLNVGAMFIPVLFLNSVFALLEWGRRKWKYLLPCWGASFLFLLLNLFTPWYFQLKPILGFEFYLKATRLYTVFVAYFIVVGSFGIALLLRGYRESSGLKRNQLKYMFWSWLGGFLAGGTTFLMCYDIQFLPWGNFLLPFVFMVATYAILRYRTMDINIVFRRGMVYSILLGLLTAISFLILLAAEHLVRSKLRYEDSLLPRAIAVLILALGFQPLRNKIQSLVDKVFFRGAYDYHETLTKTSKAMTSILDLQKLLDHLLSPIVVDMKVRSALLFTSKESNTGFQLAAFRFSSSRSQPNLPSLLPQSSDLVRWLRWKRQPLMREAIKEQVPSLVEEEMSQELDRLGADLAVPLILQEELLAILILGPKLSGDPYSHEDLQLLSTLTNQAAVAIKNAQLYEEVASIKEHHENILRNLKSGVVAVDKEGRITTFSQAAEGMTQWKASEILGKDCRMMEEGMSELLLSTLQAGEGSTGVEITLRTKEGRTIPIGVSTSVLHGQQGAVLGAIALFGDLTERKELEKEKWRAEKLAYIGTLAATVAHEIKNPLVSIKTFAQLLPEKHDDEEFRDHFSQIAMKEVDRIDLLVSQMLDLKGNTNPSRFESLHPEEIIEEIILLLSNQITRQRIHVRRCYEPPALSVWGDRFHLKQAFWNIILNGVQAMREGGTLTVSTSLAENGKDGQGKVLVKIADTGPGISEDHLGRIFDPFFTTKPEGTGLGLPISYNIIAEHRGDIRVESKLHKGTSFSVALPVTKV